MLAPEDIRAIAEQLADVLEERGLAVAPATPSPGRVLGPKEVGLMLGVDREWVYRHADELGAWRLGSGPKAQLRFDENRIQAWKDRGRAPQTDPEPAIPSRPRRTRRGTTAPLLTFTA